MCFQWVYPDCRTVGMAGMGMFDWPAVAVVLRDFHGVDLDGDLHRRLRTCMSEALMVEAKSPETAKKDG